MQLTMQGQQRSSRQSQSSQRLPMDSRWEVDSVIFGKVFHGAVFRGRAERLLRLHFELLLWFLLFFCIFCWWVRAAPASCWFKVEVAAKLQIKANNKNKIKKNCRVFSVLHKSVDIDMNEPWAMGTSYTGYWTNKRMDEWLDASLATNKQTDSQSESRVRDCNMHQIGSWGFTCKMQMQ